MILESEKVITYSGVKPGDDEEGGEDDDAQGRHGQETQAPLQVEGEGPSRERGNRRNCHRNLRFELFLSGF